MLYFINRGEISLLENLKSKGIIIDANSVPKIGYWYVFESLIFFTREIGHGKPTKYFHTFVDGKGGKPLASHIPRPDPKGLDLNHTLY